MKTFAAFAVIMTTLAPTIASASYVCDKRWNEMHGVSGASCPAGSSWDGSACISAGG